MITKKWYEQKHENRSNKLVGTNLSVIKFKLFFAFSFSHSHSVDCLLFHARLQPKKMARDKFFVTLVPLSLTHA